MKVNRVAFIKWLEFRPTVQGFDIPQTVHMFQPRQLQCDNWRISSEGSFNFVHSTSSCNFNFAQQWRKIWVVTGFRDYIFGMSPFLVIIGDHKHHHKHLLFEKVIQYFSQICSATVIGKMQIFSQLVVKHGDLSWHISRKTHQLNKSKVMDDFFCVWRALSF